MLQAFLAWDTSHVFSVRPCGDDQRQPRRCGQSCASGHTPPSSCDASRGRPSPGSVAGASHRPPVTPCAQTGEPRVIENALRTANTAPAGTDREPSDASSTSGHPHPADHHPRGGHSTRPGACPSGRGHSTPSGTAIPSPNARNVPGRTEMSPHAQDAPGRCTLRGALGSQATGTASGPVLITVARSDLMTPTCTARRWGSTGRGSGILQVGGTLVQYAQPPTSRSPPSCNRPAQSRSGPDSTSNHDFRVPAREPEGV